MDWPHGGWIGRIADGLTQANTLPTLLIPWSYTMLLKDGEGLSSKTSM
jgi:hypothetical protein